MQCYTFNEFANTKFEYYKGDKVLIKTTLLGCNTLLSLYKPGRFNFMYKGYAKCPVLTMSMNGTGMIPNGSFDLMQNMVGKAVSILNKERDGHVRTDYINHFDMGFTPEQVEYYSKKERKDTVYIPQSDLKIGHIYQTDNGKKVIYFGNCHLYTPHQNKFTHSNRSNNGVSYSKFVYGLEELVEMIYNGIQVIPKDIHANGENATLYDIVVSGFYPYRNLVDSYACAKKFVKELDTIHLPEDASFIRIKSSESFLKDTEEESCIIIRREQKSDHMATPNFALDNNGINIMMQLHKNG